ADGSGAGTNAAQAVGRRGVNALVAAGAAVARVGGQVATGPAAAVGQPLVRAAAVAAGAAVVGIACRAGAHAAAAGLASAAHVPAGAAIARIVPELALAPVRGHPIAVGPTSGAGVGAAPGAARRHHVG